MLSLYLWTYRLGIISAIIIAVVLKFGQLLFYTSILHMLLLIILGVLFRQYDKQGIIAAKIQVAGYLHTLIGFSSALLLIGFAQEPSVKLIMAPLGAALVTSIMGWFAGGEFSEKDNITYKPVKAENLPQEMQNFMQSISQSHQEYVALIQVITKDHQKLHHSQQKALQDALKVSSQLNDLLLPIATNMTDFSNSIEKASKAVSMHLMESKSQLSEIRSHLERVKGASEEVADYLEKSTILINAMEKLLQSIADKQGKL